MAKPMNFKYFFLILIMLFQIIGSSAASAETNGMTDHELTEFIKKVIRENPQLIYDTVNNYVLKMRKEQAEKKLSDKELNLILSQRVKDTIHPHNPVMGQESASVTIIEYSDFQCPYCAKGDKMVQGFINKYPGKIRFIFKNYPIQEHEQANKAALAAMAAHKQGRFWEYHDLLFQASPAIDEKTILLCAEIMKLNMEQFNNDRKSDEIKGWIEQDKADAKKLNFLKTPGFVINNVPISGVLNEKSFEYLIKQLMQ